MAEKKTAKNNPRNKTGKGGFTDHPENRNNDGAPRKGMSVTEGMKAYLEGEETITVDGKSRKVKRRALLIMAIFQDAVKGRKYGAQRMIWNYMDGSPPLNMNVSGALFTGDLASISPEDEERVRAQLDVIFGQSKNDADEDREDPDESPV